MIVLHAGPADEDVWVDLVDGICGCGVVANERQPVVADGRRGSSLVDGSSKLVAQSHGDNVRVIFRPVGHGLKTTLPVADGEVVVVEPSVAVYGKVSIERFFS